MSKLSNSSKVELEDQEDYKDEEGLISDDENDVNNNDDESSASSPIDRSHSYSHSTSTDTSRSYDDLNSIKKTLALQETKQVFRLRILVLMILFAAATSISMTVFYITRTAEEEAFRNQYDGMSEAIIESFQNILVEISAVSGLAVAATTEAQTKDIMTNQSSNSSWPFLTMPNFQRRAGNARRLSGAIYVSINPIVPSKQLPEWELYVRSEANEWIQNGIEFQEVKQLNDFEDSDLVEESRLSTGPVDPLHTYGQAGNPILSNAEGPFLPRWQMSPILRKNLLNENMFENPAVRGSARDCISNHAAVLGGFQMAPPGNSSHPNRITALFATLLSIWDQKQMEYAGDPMSHMMIPIFDKFESADRQVVAVLQSTIHWQWYLRNLLPSTNPGITVVLENECQGFFTYLLEGSEVYGVGPGDQHDTAFSKYEVLGKFEIETIQDGTNIGLDINQEGCPYFFHVYPTQATWDKYVTSDPISICLAVVSVFLFTIATFWCYHVFVERRQRSVLAKAIQSTAIVSSLFPQQVRDRLMAASTAKGFGNKDLGRSNGTRRTFTNSSGADQSAALKAQEEPIADFFPHCTVFFADIAGFTAWSSAREPAQVFILLQSLYQAFDAIAHRRRVFKVETIGDSYVAATGLPEAQPDHAKIMAKFAWDCLLRMGDITRDLEIELGPDTAELSMRIGLHSGSVTAGVLRGDRARFQLFGDTVNTAARMESTGTRGKIQVSESTASVLWKHGKSCWLTPREDQVYAKGKGKMTTYWLAIGAPIRNNGSVTSSVESGDSKVTFSHAELETPRRRLSRKENRMVDWLVDILLGQLREVIAVRERCNPRGSKNEDLQFHPAEGVTRLDEDQESITMPTFDVKVARARLDYDLIFIPENIVNLLRDFVFEIAMSYKTNPFHNFEHACHVTMSVHKLLKRIVRPELASTRNLASTASFPSTRNLDVSGRQQDAVSAELVQSITNGFPSDPLAAEFVHNFTHGITSDPLALLALLFSALIHDAGHRGVSNVQLAKEYPELADRYREKSVAEQNSLDLAWTILMSDHYEELRGYLFGSHEEMMRFRKVIVNLVLATDISDKELGEARKHRWEEAFVQQHDVKLLPGDLHDMRATIIMQHILQASDVSHTMQHWHVYQRWNRRLFEEMFQAWKAGRMGADPRTFWYEGELAFFDNYIIPLAKKLRECNVFGVSSDEYLGYAKQNRAEWQERGQAILQTMIAEVCVEKNNDEDKKIKHTVYVQPSASDYDETSKKTEHLEGSPVHSSSARVPDEVGGSQQKRRISILGHSTLDSVSVTKMTEFSDSSTHSEDNPGVDDVDVPKLDNVDRTQPSASDNISTMKMNESLDLSTHSTTSCETVMC